MGGGEVGHAETINDISDINFSVVSGNAGPYYNVNWIAIGNKGTDWGIPQYTTLPDGTTIAWGSIMKNGPTAEIIFPTKFGLFNPLVVVCPYWRNQKSEVGGAETIDNTTPTTCFVASGNAARNYYVNWIAITAKGNPSGYTAPRHVTLPDGTIIALGSFNKTTAEQNTRFGLELSFPTPPLVVVCPVWTNQHSGVGHAETIYEIYNDAFSVISGNAGQNYYVSWIAIGQAGI